MGNPSHKSSPPAPPFPCASSFIQEQRVDMPTVYWHYGMNRSEAASQSCPGIKPWRQHLCYHHFQTDSAHGIGLDVGCSCHSLDRCKDASKRPSVPAVSNGHRQSALRGRAIRRPRSRAGRSRGCEAIRASRRAQPSTRRRRAGRAAPASGVSAMLGAPKESAVPTMSLCQCGSLARSMRRQTTGQDQAALQQPSLAP